jgi:two-component system response regulator/two-component system chemotaxis response regulator CheY
MTVKNKIFHVDDEAEMHLLVKMILDKHGYELDGAFDGQEALEKLSQFRPDLILLDIAMPILDGWDLRKKLMDYDHLKDVPVVLVTAKYGSGDALQGLHDMEADGYLTKPFNPSELLSTVREILG